MSRIESSGGLRQREPRVRDRAYLGWLHDRPCVSCMSQGFTRYGVHAAHCKVSFPEAGWRAFGHSEKGHDQNASPLCADCHQYGPDAQHKNRNGDEREWWRRRGIYPPAFCAALYAAFQAGESGDWIIRRAARGEFPFPA